MYENTGQCHNIFSRKNKIVIKADKKNSRFRVSRPQSSGELDAPNTSSPDDQQRETLSWEFYRSFLLSYFILDI